MSRTSMLLAFSTLFAAHAAAQTILFGFRPNGDVLTIDPATGAATLVARNGVECQGATARATHYGRGGEAHAMYFGGGLGATADQVTEVDGWTGSGTFPIQTTGRPAGYGVRGIAFPYQEQASVFVILASADPTTQNLLAHIDLTTGSCGVVGPMGRSDLRSLAMLADGGPAYAVGTENGGGLYTIDLSTGVATLVGGGNFAGDAYALVFVPNGPHLVCGANLRSIDLTTGATTLIGPTGFDDIHGMAATRGCYPNCSDGAPPILTVNDLICFQSAFSAGAGYANCDLSTTPPILNVNDFVCFMRRFASGCTSF